MNTLRSSAGILELLDSGRADLERNLTRALLDLTFENRYTLHPRRLGALGVEIIRHFCEFLRQPVEADVDRRGAELSQEGLGYSGILAIGTIFREFFLERGWTGPGAGLKEALRAVDRYMNACLTGYMKAREAQVLQEQEQLRRALADALEQQRQELFVKNHAIHSSINGIMLTDLSGRITYVNPSYLRLFGYEKAEELVGRQNVELWADDQTREIVRRLPEMGGWHGELTARRKDNTVTEVEISASQIRDNTGQAVGTMAFFVDITDRKRLESQFRQAQKMDALGQLASGIVHDVNNLLTAISGYAQLELIGLEEGSQQYDSLSQIKKATDRGRGLTQQLRVFTRQATGVLHSINLNTVVEETCELLKRTLPPSITIVQSLDPALELVNADPTQMSQLLMNLCVNARDAMIMEPADGQGGQSFQISGGRLALTTGMVHLNEKEAARFLGAHTGRYVRISVSDTGAGMDREVLERLFEPFFTTKGKQSGMGLGLAVVYGIVQNHHGFIDVRSFPGAGTTFEIYLPVADRLLEETVADEPVGKLVEGSGNILVVEDEPQVREMVIRTLERCGYRVQAAENGLAAIQLYRERREPFHLVILDMVMPKMGGWECFQQLRRIDPAVRVLVMTGYTSSVNPQQILREGAVGFLEKPLNLHTFSQIVREGIGI